jgi:LPXTG-site transpeptidase (sortase) family protein
MISCHFSCSIFPTIPVVPTAPKAPVVPTSPTTPTSPIVPTKPSTTTPITPSGPTSPVSPTTPTKDINAENNIVKTINPVNQRIQLLDNDTYLWKIASPKDVKITILDTDGVQWVTVDKKTGTLILPDRISGGKHTIKYRITSTTNPELYDDAYVSIIGRFETFILPASLPDTGTALIKKWVKTIAQKLVDTTPQKFFEFYTSLSDAPRSLSSYLQHLPESERGAMQYVVIPSAGIIAPIVEADRDSVDFQTIVSGRHVEINNYLHNGVMHYPTSAFGGEFGNMILSGHSSYWKKDNGKYKTVFGNLPTVDAWEEIWVYEKKRGNKTGKISYILSRYQVTASYNTNPRDVAVLLPEEGKKLITLITCTPIW